MLFDCGKPTGAIRLSDAKVRIHAGLPRSLNSLPHHMLGVFSWPMGDRSFCYLPGSELGSGRVSFCSIVG